MPELFLIGNKDILSKEEIRGVNLIAINLRTPFWSTGNTHEKIAKCAAAEEAAEMTYTSKHLLVAVLAITTLSAGAATAASVTGQQLFSLCTANMTGNGNALEAAECMGFIVGVADTFDCIDADQLFNRTNSEKTSQPELVQHVVNYLEKHPAAKQREAFSVVGLALAAYFPCQPTAMIRGIKAPPAN